MLLHDVVVIVN